MRAERSTPPPAANGTIRVMSRLGQSSARAWTDAKTQSAARYKRFICSPPAKQPLDIAKFQFDISGPAVIALAGIRRRFHLAQQRIHFLAFEPPPGAHRAVTGHAGGDSHQPPLERQGLVPFADVVGEIADETRAVNRAKERRRLAQRDRAGAERFEHKAKARQLVRTRGEPLDVGLVELDDFRNEQDLSRHAALRKRGFQLLVNDALVRGVLVDNDQAVARLRHDVSLMQLRACGAERMIKEIGRRASFGFAGARRQSRLRGGATMGWNAAMVAAPPLVAARIASRASAAFSAETINARTTPALRKRTSALAGCTLTSTSRGGVETNKATSGWRSRGR